MLGSGGWTSQPTLAVKETFQNYEHLQSICNVSPFPYAKISAHLQQALVNGEPRFIDSCPEFGVIQLEDCRLITNLPFIIRVHGSISATSEGARRTSDSFCLM